MCCILKDTEYVMEEPGWCCDNVFYIIIITPQPLLAGAGPGPAVTSGISPRRTALETIDIQTFFISEILAFLVLKCT